MLNPFLPRSMKCPGPDFSITVNVFTGPSLPELDATANAPPPTTNATIPATPAVVSNLRSMIFSPARWIEPCRRYTLGWQTVNARRRLLTVCLGGTMSDHERYTEMCRAHSWDVPARYNIAHDVCDKHPREKPAMAWESFDGSRRELSWGELQDMADQAAALLRQHGVERGDRVAVVLPPTPETAAVFFAVWKLGAMLLSLSLLYADDAIRYRLDDSGASVVVTDQANAGRFTEIAAQLIVLDPGALSGTPAEHIVADTAAEDPAQLYYTSGTTGLAKGIVHAHRYLLGHEEFTYCHEVQDGESFHGMGEWAWAEGIAPLLGPWRLGAVQYVYRRERGFDAERQLAFLSRNSVSNVFTTPTAMRAMMAVADAGTRHPQRFRRVCSAGEPLNPEAIRWFREQFGVTVLDYYGLTESYPLVANYPSME